MPTYESDAAPMPAASGFALLLKGVDVGDLLDDIASSNPPAYLLRCFAEGLSAPYLSWARVQQLAVCAMALDAVVHARDYAGFEPELVADWRQHYAAAFARLTSEAAQALRRARLHDSVVADPVAPEPVRKAEVAAELVDLERRLVGEG
jgi:hypothetical protein